MAAFRGDPQRRGMRMATLKRKPKFRKGERVLCVGGCGVVRVQQVDYLAGQRRFQYHVSDEGGANETVAHAARYLRKLPNRKMRGA
jgi:hypothetical protein